MDSLVDLIYEAVIEPATWPRVLSDLVDRTGGNGAILLSSDIVTGEGDVVLSRYNDDNAWGPYEAYYAAINPLHNVADPVAYSTGWQPKILRDEDWIARETLQATEYYNDFLLPNDACYGLYLRLALDGQTLTTISIGRGHTQGRFDNDALAAVAPLHDDLIRAAKLSQRFVEVQRFGAGATAAMDFASEPLFLLDSGGRIVYANQAGEKVLSDGVLLRLRSGRLTATEQGASSAFARALLQAAAPHERRGDTIVLASVDGSSVGSASVLPISPETGIGSAYGPAVLVRVSPLAAGERLTAAMDRWKLTRAERALACALVDGLTLKAAASARGISINTARCQLVGLFEKTGARRQIDLVRLLTQAQ